MDAKQKDSSGLWRQKAENAVHFLLACLQACMTPKDHRASVSFTSTEIKFIHSVIFMVETLSNLYECLSKAQSLGLTAMAEEESRHYIWKTYHAGKRAVLLHYEYEMFNGFADVLKFPAEVLNMLEQPASFSVGLFAGHVWPGDFYRSCGGSTEKEGEPELV